MENVIHEKHLLQSKFKEKFAFLYDKHSLFYYVIILILVGLGFFGYALLTEKFTTPYSGDFAQQYYAFEYNFYDDWWTFFKTGHFPFYDENTFLGADNIVSNTYYGLFSPFTFPILFFPRSFIPQAMALMSIAKLVTGALLFRIYLKYMGASEASARIFSIAYAFMGWTAYYLWFNNFMEVLTFLPLILFGIEKVIRQKQIWAVSLGFFFMALGNYFFLLTFGIFGVIYAGFRFFQTIKERGGWKNYKDHLAVLGLGIAGFALGYLMAAVVLFPAVVGSFGISRASTSSKYLDVLKEAFKAKDYDKAFEIMFKWWHPNIVKYNTKPDDYYFAYAFPVASYFYPTLSCRYVNIVGYSSFENAGSSIFFFTPCIIMFGGCLYRSFIHKKVSHFLAIAICIFCLFVPFFYFLSGAFTNNYGRWEIVVPTMGLVYIALNYDHRNEIPRVVILISGLVALACMISTYFLAVKLIEDYGYDPEIRSSSYLYALDSDDQIAVVWYETILCSIETFVIAGFWKKKYLNIIVRLFVIGEVIVMGTVVANMHYLQSMEDDVNTGLEPLSHQVALIDKVNKEDNSFFRMYSSVADESHVNIPAAENFNGMTTFHTFYNNNVDDFVHMMNMMTWEESWSSHYLMKHQYLESFLGVKYYVTRDSDTTYYKDWENGIIDKVYEPNVPLGYSLHDYDEVNGYRVYKNNHHIDFGIAYDSLYYKHQVNGDEVHNQFYPDPYSKYVSKMERLIRNEEMLFKGVILNDSDLDEVNNSYPNIFNVYDEAPKREMPKTNAYRIATYAPYEWKTNESGEKYKEYQFINPKDPTGGFKPEFQVTDLYDKTIPVNALQMVYVPLGGETFPCGEDGTYFILDYPIRATGDNYNTCVWLIDESGQVITFDEARNTESDTAFVGRALYSKVPVSRIILCPMNGDSVICNNSYLPLYYQPYEEVNALIDKAADNGIMNLKKNVNTFTFNTNYESEKFFVTQLAFTNGWKLKATAKDGTVSYPKIYNAQGGFAGFVAPKGEYSYELTYRTPDFVKWALVSFAAFLGVGALTAAPIILKKRKEKRGEPLTSTN